jgi:hypothetical protein
MVACVQLCASSEKRARILGQWVEDELSKKPYYELRSLSLISFNCTDMSCCDRKLNKTGVVSYREKNHTKNERHEANTRQNWKRTHYEPYLSRDEYTNWFRRIDSLIAI